ncbi:hypothetical protein PHMEG_00015967 [Phytophthora megakarya]|uniref:Uncharacterized protein n=1 Tax=Phytophthora megakarya TaxID=4795 RepID=A0A225W1K0_9STRA|nr:hypothetical protein PHMEG_00015967 [Phytophthora megakarya]
MDYLHQATEEHGEASKKHAVKMVAIVDYSPEEEKVPKADKRSSKEIRTCFNYDKVGLLARDCPDKDKEEDGSETKITLAVRSGEAVKSDMWISDSGSSVHLVKDDKLLRKLSKKGDVVLRTAVGGNKVVIELSEVYYGEHMSDNIISCEILEEKNVYLERIGSKSYIVQQALRIKDCTDNIRKYYGARFIPNAVQRLFSKAYHVLSVHLHGILISRLDMLLFLKVNRHIWGAATVSKVVNAVNAVTEAVEEGAQELEDAVTETTLLELHKRLRHLGCDTVERMTDEAGSGIKMTIRERLNCLSCAQGKQSKVNQSKKDTGANAPIDTIGGAIGSDIKGPMTTRDRRGNR